jgi:predicted nuclease of predicted toxin-antitoxin system
VKLLFDENLSRKLVARFADLFPGSTHVAYEGLSRHPDIEVWQFAKERGFAIVSADADFYQLASTLGAPPKVIWLRECDYPARVAERLLREQAIRIARFGESEEEAVLIVTPAGLP